MLGRALGPITKPKKGKSKNGTKVSQIERSEFLMLNLKQEKLYHSGKVVEGSVFHS